jgi:acetylornithine deacetylase/succinyl-diaminopimelate desuccinylase-like protein
VANTESLRGFLQRTIADLVAIPSPSGQETSLADYVAAALRGSGLTPERDGDDNVWVGIGSGDRCLHLNAHLDTVVPVDGWVGDPFTARLDGARLHGLGSSDCKGGVAGLLWLAPRISPKIRVVVSFTACEEGVGLAKPNGSERMAAMGGDWAILCEPSCDGEGPRLGVGTQGHARANVRFKGKAAHSSVPEDGVNAIHAASRFCAGLEKLNASFPKVELAPGACFRATVAPTIVAGGKLSNIIPDACEVTVSRRLAPGESVATFRAELDRLLAGADASFTVASDGPCAMAARDGALLAAAREACASVGMPARELFVRGRTDAVIFARHGVDTMSLGPGETGQAHVANEFVNLDSAASCVRLLEALVNSLG